MLSDLKLLSQAQLEKAAIDSGFDVAGGAAGNAMAWALTPKVADFVIPFRRT